MITPPRSLPGALLIWINADTHRGQEAFLKDFHGGDGVRFTLTHHPTCYRRGPWRLLVEVAEGKGHIFWGCFDDADQPMRYYHQESAALSEAQAIADVLAGDRVARDRQTSGER